MVKFRSKGYNFNFDTTNGYFARWGSSKQDDPHYSPFGPELADIEISTICDGGCSFCYKSNTGKGENMSIETFKKVFAKLPKIITGQIAFGIGNLDGNPDLKAIFEYSREHGVIPNVTIRSGDTGLNLEWGKWLANTCGAVAVSNYKLEDTVHALELLHACGVKQLNIHQLLAHETQEQIYSLMNAYLNKQLVGLKAIVLLSLKKKGRGKRGYNIISEPDFAQLVKRMIDNNIPLGFDSCTAGKFLRNVESPEKYEESAEKCEAAAFSSYFNVRGDFFPCSFTEGTAGWEKGIKLEDNNDFWFSPRVKQWRENLLDNGRSCPIYEI